MSYYDADYESSFCDVCHEYGCVDAPKWLEQYVGRMFDTWQLRHGLVETQGREAAVKGIAVRIVNRPGDLDEITAEDMAVETTKVMFGILAFAGGVQGGAADCLNRLCFRLLSMEIGTAQHYNEMHNFGDKTSFSCPCDDM